MDIFLWLCYMAVGAMVFYFIIKYAVKNGVKEALWERDQEALWERDAEK